MLLFYKKAKFPIDDPYKIFTTIVVETKFRDTKIFYLTVTKIRGKTSPHIVR